MICQQKNRETYTELFATMTKALPELKERLRAFGQDGEDAIFTAHTNEFPFSISFLDTIHMRRNLEQFIVKDCHLSTAFFESVITDKLVSLLADFPYYKLQQ